MTLNLPPWPWPSSPAWPSPPFPPLLWEFDPVHWMCTESVSDICNLLGMKSYSTAGYTCTMFPRFPRTLTLKILSDLMAFGRVKSLKTWLRSWNMRPVWSVLMLRRRADLPPTSTYGLSSIGEAMPSIPSFLPQKKENSVNILNGN